MSDFTTEEWKGAGDGFIYATRLAPGLDGAMREENVFDFQMHSRPIARPGEMEANARLIRQAKNLHEVLFNLVRKMNAAGDKQGWRDDEETYCGFISADFDSARRVLMAVEFASIIDQK